MQTKTILLVEDDFLNRRLTKKNLTEQGYLVLEAKNTNEALQILETTKLTLAILDINLGQNEQNGITLGQQIQEKFNLPFIYLTAYDTPNVIHQAIATKPYSYLTKPFKNVDLIALIEIAIAQTNTPKKTPSIPVKDGDYNLNLPLDDINYIVSEGNYLLFHTNKKIYKTRSTIKEILHFLPKNSFIQTHRAYIINKHKVEKFNLKELIINNTIIPISKNFITNF